MASVKSEIILRRIFALTLDGIVIILIDLPIAEMLGLVQTTNAGGGSAFFVPREVGYPLLIAILAVYCIVTWCTMGGTPAQRLFGLRVFDVETSDTVHPQMASVRWSVLFGPPVLVEWLVPGVWLAVPLLWWVLLLATTLYDPRMRGLHDTLSRSAVRFASSEQGLAFARGLLYRSPESARRGVAWAVDAAIVSWTPYIVLPVLLHPSSLVDATLVLYALSGSVVLSLVYHVGSWCWQGSTPGHALLGLQIAEVGSGDRLAIWPAVRRWFVTWGCFIPISAGFAAGQSSVLHDLGLWTGSAWLFAIGFSVVHDENGRGLQDRAANSWVVRRVAGDR